MLTIGLNSSIGRASVVCLVVSITRSDTGSKLVGGKYLFFLFFFFSLNIFFSLPHYFSASFFSDFFSFVWMCVCTLYHFIDTIMLSLLLLSHPLYVYTNKKVPEI